MPATPAELVAAVPDPLKRFVLVTALIKSRRGNAPTPWSAQRDADLRALLTGTAPVPQCEIAEAAAISRPRVSELARRVLGGSPA